MLDHGRADLLAFSVVPIHCSLASLAGSRLAWEAARHVPGFPLRTPSRAPCKGLAGITPSSRSPLCAAAIWLSTGESPCPCPVHDEGLIFQEILSSELFSLFSNDRLFCSSDHSDFCICTFSMGYLRVCQMTSLMACSRWHHHEVRSCLEQVRSALQLAGTGRAGWDAPGAVRVQVTPKRSLYSSCDLESDKKHGFPQVYKMFG